MLLDLQVIVMLLGLAEMALLYYVYVQFRKDYSVPYVLLRSLGWRFREYLCAMVFLSQRSEGPR